MMQLIPRFFWTVACACGLLLTAVQTADAQSSAARVESALKSLHQWVGTGAKGEGWRSHLMSDELEAQLAKRENADRLVVSAILARYSGSEAGLELRRFVAVRQALAAWLDELPPVAVSDLVAAARQTRTEFSKKSDADVQQALRRLDQAVADMDRVMARWASDTRTGWQNNLDWQPMKEQLAAESPDLRKLQAIQGKLYANQEGFELPQFAAFRDALRAYLDVSMFAANAKAQEFHERFADELAERLETYVQQPNTDDAVRIGQIIGWMARYGQAPELVTAVRQHFSRPNLFVQLSESMLRTGIETRVDERTRVREDILGTAIHGSATLKGRVSIDLVPNANSAAIDLLLTGTTYSNNTGYNGPVTIFSSGVTSVDARKRVLVDAEGITTHQARAACRTSSQIHCISAKSPLIEKVAWKRVRQSKSQAEVIASQRASRRVAAQMNSEVVEVLAPAKELFAEKFRNPLLRRDGFPRELLLSTTDDRLFIRALQAGVDQLAAPDEPPALTGEHDVAARIHESLVGNLSQAYIGGVTWDDERIAILAERLTGDVPPALRITRDDDPWSITFANERPFDARFDDNRITMILRAKRFTRAEQELRENVEIKAIYQVEKTERGSRMVRQGDVDVNFGDGKSLSVGNVAMKAFVRKKFESLFQEKFESDGVALPGRWQMAGKMRLDQLNCGKGWLVFGWYQPSLDTRVASRN
jgi:hypothetical protein